MTTTTRALAGLATLGLFALAGGSPVGAADEYGRTHALNTIDKRLAETLVWEICEGRRSGERCVVRVASPGGINVLGTDEVHAAVTRMLLERDRSAPQTLRYHLTLVRAKERNGGKPADLPANIQKALDAVSELLPFKAFEILDSGLVTTAEWAETVFGDESDLTYPTGLRVQSLSLDDRGFRTSIAVEVRKGGEENVILGSVFNVYEGETVVAGSSRTSADAALMLIVTALPVNGR